MPRGGRRIRSGCCAWNSGANSRSHRDVGDGGESLGFRRRRHVAEGFAAGLGKRGAAIGQNQPGGDAGVANGHLQRHEPAIAVAEHDGVIAAGTIRHHLRHSVGHGREVAAHRRRPAEARQFRNQHPERLRQARRDGIEAGAIRQQRMKQKKRRSVAELGRIHGAAREKSIHRSLLQGLRGPVERAGWAGLITQNSTISKLCHLT